jgi:two-component system, LuxR family, response regulator FixJ
MEYASETSSSADPLDEVLVLDDDPQVLRLVLSVVRSLGLKVRGYQDSDDLLRNPSAPAPLCLIIDWQLQGVDGLEVIAQCQRCWPQSPVILISGHATVPVAVSAMRKGVVGVLEKPLRLADLRREILAAIQLGRERSKADARRRDARARLEQLTDGERSVLTLLVDGTPNKNIAAQMNLAMRTIEKYRRSLFDKLGVDSAAEAARVWMLAKPND